jgi:hypothetical protein
MSDRTPEVGDAVMHHGRLHEITEIRPNARVVDGSAERVDEAVWENDRYLVRGRRDELEWLEADEAWHLPGRLLCRDERAVHEAVVGTWPRAESHVGARKYLDTIELAFQDEGGDVPRERLVEVLQRRKGYDVPDGVTWDEDDWRTHAEQCLEHCREVRAIREEG